LQAARWRQPVNTPKSAAQDSRATVGDRREFGLSAKHTFRRGDLSSASRRCRCHSA